MTPSLPCVSGILRVAPNAAAGDNEKRFEHGGRRLGPIDGCKSIRWKAQETSLIACENVLPWMVGTWLHVKGKLFMTFLPYPGIDK
jgi:hypothetical protein